MRELQALIQKNPKDTSATLEFANSLYDVGFFDRAAELYERYLAIAPGNADARVDLGTAYYNMALADSAKRTGLIAKAESCFQVVVRTTPGHQMARFNLGIVRLQQGDMPGARDWFERCVAIDSTTAIADRARELLSEHVRVKK
jgi:tetratricopeptide (TPR) repeat protein